MPDETETETETASTRKRSQLTKQLNTLGELIRILKPYSPEDRKRLLDTAGFMMGGE